MILMASDGILICGSNREIQTRLPPGTPDPVANTNINNANLNITAGVMETSKIFDMNKAVIIWVTQLPFIFMVAPNGRENGYIFSEIPRDLSQTSMDVGREAILDANVYAVTMAGENFLKKIKGFTRAKIKIIIA